MNIGVKLASLYKKFLLSVFILFVLSGGAVAESAIYTGTVDVGNENPVRIEDGQLPELMVDMGLLFESIERVCIKGSISGGSASSMLASVLQEVPPGSTEQRLSLSLFQLTYDTGSSSVPDQEVLYTCFSSVFTENLLDGLSSFRLSVQGGYVELWDLQVEVEGVLSDTQVYVDVKNDEEAVPFYGGKIEYDVRIQNLDSGSTEKHFTYWSVIKFPNGDVYPVSKPKSVVLSSAEIVEFDDLEVNIPNWFEAGEYQLIWIVADTEAKTRVEHFATFTKE